MNVTTPAVPEVVANTQQRATPRVPEVAANTPQRTEALEKTPQAAGEASYVDPATPRGAPQSLQSLLAQALDADPQLLASRALAVASEERRLQALSRFGPVLNAQATRGKAETLTFGRQVEGRTDQSTMGARWNLFNAGADFAEYRGTTQEVAASKEDVRRAREEIGERIATTYAELLRHEELLPLARMRVREAKRLLAQVERATELGRLSEADSREAKAGYLDAEVQMGQLLADLRATRDRMTVLVGAALQPTMPVHLPAQYLGPSAPASTTGIVAAAKLRAEAAGRRVLPWLSTIAPRLDLEYNEQISNRTVPTPDPQRLNGWLLTASWDLPLGGENQARRAESVARAAAAKAEADRVLRTVEAELATLPPG